MRPVSKNISNLDTLDKEIRKLKATAKAMEHKWDENFDYLQVNYLSMVKNSVLKTTSPGESLGGSMVKSFLNNDRLQHSTNRIIEHFAGKAAEWIDSLANRLIKK